MGLNKELVGVLACPACRGELVLLPAEDGLACGRCQVVYPVREEIPVMLVEEAVPSSAWTGSKQAVDKGR